MNYIPDWHYSVKTFMSDNKVIEFDKWNNIYISGEYINGKIYYDPPYNGAIYAETIWYDESVDSLIIQLPNGSTYYYKKLN